MLPAFVMPMRKADVDEGPPLRTLGLANELHAGLVRQAVALAGVAGDARAHDVFPSRLPAPVARQDMVEVEIAAVEDPVAILAGVRIAFEDVVAREFDLLLGEALEKEKNDDPGNAHLQADRPGHLGLWIGLGKIFPAFEIVSEEIVLLIRGDHLRMPLVEEREGATRGAGIDRLPKAIEHKNRLIQDRFHISKRAFSAPRTGGRPGKLAEASTAGGKMSTSVNSL